MTKELKSLDKKGIDLDQRVLTLDKKEIIFQNEPLTIRRAIKTAILTSDMEKKTPEERYEAYKLAVKLETSNPNFTHEEWSKIKKAVGTTWYPETVGFIWDAIEDSK
jgi:hypothetical protein